MSNPSPVTPADVVAFLGEPTSPELTALVQKHLDVVTSFVWSYVRGQGFTDEGAAGRVPNRDIRSVIVAATARYVPNPTQVERESGGTQTVKYASLNGFTLAEQAVLNLYRRRAA